MSGVANMEERPDFLAASMDAQESPMDQGLLETESLATEASSGLESSRYSKRIKTSYL